MGRDIGLLPVLLGVALQDGGAQRLDVSGTSTRSPRPSCACKVLCRLSKTTQVGRRAHAPALGGKPNRTIPTFFSAVLPCAAGGQAQGLFHEAVDPFEAGRHRLVVGARRGSCRNSPLQPSGPWRPPKTVGFVAPSISGRAISIVVSTGPSPPSAGRPLTQRLELQRMRGDVGHVEALQHLDRGIAVVVGGPADQAEPGQRDHRVDAPALGEIRRKSPGRPSSPPAKAGITASPAPAACGSPRRNARYRRPERSSASSGGRRSPPGFPGPADRQDRW
jgi:hypothetical protein